MKKKSSDFCFDSERKAQLSEFLENLSIDFNNFDLLNIALSHSSYSNELDQKSDNNERLEFLGDSVLNLIITDYLYKTYPNKSEGELSKARSYIVSEDSLSSIAREIDLGSYILLGRGEESNDGRNKKGILADAIEAFVGAIYLDSGFSIATEFVVELFDMYIRLMFNRGDFKDYKSLLQEYVQKKYKISPSYKLDKEIGPDHDKVFCVELYVGEKFISNGKGKSKKEAEMRAAEVALKAMENINL
ncbi:ribonuclease III [Borreliella turdi]|uniref:ribonuclease III n=1 Tax=Borreliella turdi TaxID=57863 RepID=UPI0012463202|nr:ribonuclease III [Borreliella turdi]